MGDCYMTALGVDGDVDKAYERFSDCSDKVKAIEYHSKAYDDLCQERPDIDVFYHLAWEGVAPEKKSSLYHTSSLTLPVTMDLPSKKPWASSEPYSK